MDFQLLVHLILGMMLVVKEILQRIVVVVLLIAPKVVDHSHLMELVITYPMMINLIYN